MNWIKTISVKNINILLGVLCISFVLFSCEADEVYPVATNISFDLPNVVSVGENLELMLQAEGDFDAVEWIISDGTKYHTLQLKHQFSRTGNYSIEAKTFLNGIATSTLTKDIDVYYSSKTISLKASIYAQEVFYSENKIIIRSTPEKTQTLETLTSYIILDKDLNIISEINNSEDIDKQIESVFRLGDSVLAFNSNNNNTQSFFQFKSANDQKNFNSENSSFINYSTGFIYQRNEGEKGFFVDYYNESNEKLWTKSFEDGKIANSKYVFNINNKLFYLSFDSNSDNVYIEKFKNPSVVFEKNTISLSNSVYHREVVFAISNSASNAIEFAIYNPETDKTIIYKVYEDCSIENLITYNGRFEGTPQFCTTNGAVFVTDKNRITKYNANWSINSIKEIANSDFGICPLGDNLNLLFENLSSGEIRLSYLDKHLNPVLFE